MRDTDYKEESLFLYISSSFGGRNPELSIPRFVLFESTYTCSYQGQLTLLDISLTISLLLQPLLIIFRRRSLARFLCLHIILDY
jgi:hypothetical protein